MFRLTSGLAKNVSFLPSITSRTFSTISATVQSCQESLAQNDVTDKKYIADFARQHILVQQRNQMLKNSQKVPHLIYFLCGHNAGRSQMAEGWLRHYAGYNAISISGGSTPIDTINPQAAEAMSEKGIDISQHYPKPHMDSILNTPDAFVITMGCGEVCTRSDGTCTRATCRDWALPDPHGEGISVVRDIRDNIETNVIELCNELGMLQSQSLDVGEMLKNQFEKELLKNTLRALSENQEIASIMEEMVKQLEETGPQ